MESHFKKMVLVPFDYQNENFKLDNLTNPLYHDIEKNIQEKSKIVNSLNLDGNEKTQHLNKNSRQFSVFAKKIFKTKLNNKKDKDKLEINPISDYNFLPKTVQKIAPLLINKLKSSKKVKFFKTGEISIYGKKFKNSNINDLINNVLRNQKFKDDPPHVDKFIKFLSELNVPEYFIKNKKRLEQFKQFKKIKIQSSFSEGSDSDASLPAHGFSLQPSLKRKRTRVDWINANE